MAQKTWRISVYVVTSPTEKKGISPRFELDPASVPYVNIAPSTPCCKHMFSILVPHLKALAALGLSFEQNKGCPSLEGSYPNIVRMLRYSND